MYLLICGINKKDNSIANRFVKFGESIDCNLTSMCIEGLFTEDEMNYMKKERVFYSRENFDKIVNKYGEKE